MLSGHLGYPPRTCVNHLTIPTLPGVADRLIFNHFVTVIAEACGDFAGMSPKALDFGLSMHGLRVLTSLLDQNGVPVFISQQHRRLDIIFLPVDVCA